MYDGKRYRIHNNYLTFGGGFVGTTLRDASQKGAGADFNFRIKRKYFQLGVGMSGEAFLSNNNVQMHLGYGIRKETIKTNLAAFAGVSYNYGVIPVLDTAGTIPLYYNGAGIYVSAQAITKFSYDIGIGLELFGEFVPKQTLYMKSQKSKPTTFNRTYLGNIPENYGVVGIRVILYFSGAYRGLKQKYNPHVRSENKK